jgi:subtilisin family serine protease
MSLAGEDNPGALLQDAVDYAYGKGLLILAAAGNYAVSGGSVPNPIMYPAALPRVVSVAASDQIDYPASFSEHNQYVDLAAPGMSIYSTAKGGDNYGYMSGTSMATPYVSALAALVWSVRPDWTNAQVEAHLKATAAKVGPYPYVAGRNDYLGSGRIDAAAAVWSADPPTLAASPASAVGITTTDQVVRSVRLTSTSSLPLSVGWSVTPAVSWLQVSPAGPVTVSRTQPVTLTLVITPGSQPMGLLQAELDFTTSNPFAKVVPNSVPVQVTHTETIHRMVLRIFKDYTIP